MLTNRDIDLLKFLNRYGKTYIEVLGCTFFNSEQMARNRINKLYKDNLLSYWNTGLMRPRRAIVLTKDSKELLFQELGENVKNAKMNKSTIEHNVMEQIVDFYLQTIGAVERTTVYTHFKQLHHVPDLMFTNEKEKRYYIEIELNKKSENRYKEIVLNMLDDNPDGVIYITDTVERAKAIAKIMPKWDKLYFIDLNKFISNVTNDKKIRPFKQDEIV